MIKNSDHNMIKINGDDLATVTKNALMFANPKSLYLPGEVLFDLTDGMLKVFACDDYFAICSQAKLVMPGEKFFVLNLADVKTLEEFSRKNKKDEIQISLGLAGVDFDTTDNSISFNYGEFREDNWYVVEGLIFDPSVSPVWIQEFDSNPERYAKLSQLKYDKNEHWIKWNFVETATGNLLVRFTVGPDIAGVIRPLSEPEKHHRMRKGGDDGTETDAQISLPD
jgi:hypothetical protein